MAVPSYLIAENGELLHVESVGPHTHLVVEDHARVASQFKTNSIAVASTAIVVAPPSGTAIVVTDMIASAEKVSGGSITVQFTDGANTVVLFKAALGDAPTVVSHPFAGRVRGWVDARIDMVGVGTNIDADVTIVYYVIRGEGVLSFADWDTERG